jgi:hypothetical protein
MWPITGVGSQLNDDGENLDLLPVAQWEVEFPNRSFGFS